MKNEVKHREELFWTLADELLKQRAVSRSTMMGYPCLRYNGTFFVCIERAGARPVMAGGAVA